MTLNPKEPTEPPEEPPAQAAEEGEADPRYTLIIVGDDGKMYKLTKEIWSRHEMTQPVAMGLAQQLKQFGTYLAYIPTDLAVGVGNFCTLINLDAILRNNPGGGGGRGGNEPPPVPR